MPKPPRKPPTDVVAEAESMKADERAREKAFAGAQPHVVDLNDAGVKAYARSAVERESDLLARTIRGGRNDQLNRSAFNLGQLVGAGVLDENDIYQELRSACEANGYIRQDGINAFDKSFRSGMGDGIKEPRDLSGVGTGGITEYIAVPVPVRLKPDKLTEMEGGFWTARTSLHLIYLAALARMAPPWAVLACCAAKALALCPARVKLPPIIGGAGSLNWLCVLAAPSGMGKGAALAVMDELIKSTVYQRNIGSGEGMTEMYKKPANKETGEPAGRHESIMFVADEIDTLTARSRNQQSTTLPMLRSAFSGVMLGSSTRASGGFHVPAHEYRLTLIVGAQPERATTILEDTYGGTPQRFQWFPAIDHRIDIERPEFPGELDLPTPMTSDVWKYGMELVVPERVERAIVAARVKAQRGEADPHKSHALYVREKFAYALTILDGRDRLNEDDWELSGVAMKVSDFTREWVARSQERAKRTECEDHGYELGMTYAAADQEKQATTENIVNRIAGRALSLMEHGPISNRELHRKIAHRDRPYLATALERLTTSEKAICADGQWTKFDDQQPF